MRLLLDTHIAIWAVYFDARLPTATHDLISKSERVFVSAASIWEISIKHALHARRDKAAFPISGPDAMTEFERAGFALLSVTATHAAEVSNLPLHHGDPFDRLLVAQAQSEPLRLITADKILARYGSLVTIV